MLSRDFRRLIHDAPDLLQRESELPQKEHSVQPLHVCRSVQAIARFAPTARYEKTDLVVVVEGTNGHVRHSRHLANGVLHGAHRTYSLVPYAA